MTEEEMAEEIAKDIYIHHFDDDINYPYVLKAITVGVQKGAEHGYNKAKVEARLKLKDEGIIKSLKGSILRNERLSSQEQQELCAWIECAMDFGENLDECAKELEKANEWHYPSKGEYPIDKTEMLVYFKYADYEYPCKTFGFYNGHFWDTKRGDVSNKEVIAWKEIVFPEERIR